MTHQASPVLIVGSMAFDDLELPSGSAKDVVGGSATYGAYAASIYAPVRLVAVVGDDFPAAHTAWLKQRGIDVDGLIHKPGKTFHWKGRYGLDLNEAQTLGTDLNVFADFDPVLPASYLDARTVFPANIDPDLQRKVLSQVKAPKLIGMDSMNL